MFLQEYGSIANVLDYTTVVIPVTKANKSLDQADPNYKPLNEVDKQNWLACKRIKEHVHTLADTMQMTPRCMTAHRRQCRFSGADSTKKSFCRSHSSLWMPWRTDTAPVPLGMHRWITCMDTQQSWPAPSGTKSQCTAMPLPESLSGQARSNDARSHSVTGRYDIHLSH